MNELNDTARNYKEWWLGIADMASAGLAEGALSVERVHLSIADTTFNVLGQLPVTRPVSEPVRFLHHGISRLCYRGVAGAGRLINRGVQML